MFEKPSGNRLWQCFICGVQHPDYELFVNHIKSEHEEGREYISCPACEAPEGIYEHITT